MDFKQAMCEYGIAPETIMEYQENEAVGDYRIYTAKTS